MAMELEYVKVTKYYKPKRFVCPYNGACWCTQKICRACGWNPKVAQRRKEKLLGRNKTYG